jgi:hypothetical protein
MQRIKEQKARDRAFSENAPRAADDEIVVARE